MSLLEVDNLSKQFNNFTLKNISLTLPKGYVMGYVGQNGAGKTTTIKLITEQYKHQKGTIKIDGITYTDNPVLYKNSIGYISDNFYYPEFFTIEMIEKTLQDFYPSFNIKTFKTLINQWSLPYNTKVDKFSRGMKIRLMFASVLSRETKLLILDEATSGLDPVVRNEVLKLIQNYISDGERSVLFSTHIMDDLESIADYIYFINNGQMILNGTKDDLLDDFIIVKGGNNELTNDLKKELIGYTQTHLGFEGLMSSNNMHSINRKISIEKSTINQIVVFHIQGNRR